MSDEIVLYDLPSRQGTAWSLNPWKTRLALNFKGLPYKTEWIEYPDLKPTFEKFGIPPNKSGYPYTSPAIRLPSGEYGMDSRHIIDKLEALAPTPSLHLDSPYQARLEALLPAFFECLRPLYLPLVPKIFLNPPSQKYFVADREASVGMSLDDFGKGLEKGLQAHKPHLKKVTDMYKENSDGPFLLGKQVSYADFVVVAWLRMMEGVGYLDYFFGQEGGEELKKVYEACGKWLKRDSY